MTMMMTLLKQRQSPACPHCETTTQIRKHGKAAVVCCATVVAIAYARFRAGTFTWLISLKGISLSDSNRRHGWGKESNDEDDPGDIVVCVFIVLALTITVPMPWLLSASRHTLLSGRDVIPCNPTLTSQSPVRSSGPASFVGAK